MIDAFYFTDRLYRSEIGKIVAFRAPVERIIADIALIQGYRIAILLYVMPPEIKRVIELSLEIALQISVDRLVAREPRIDKDALPVVGGKMLRKQPRDEPGVGAVFHHQGAVRQHELPDDIEKHGGFVARVARGFGQRQVLCEPLVLLCERQRPFDLHAAPPRAVTPGRCGRRSASTGSRCLTPSPTPPPRSQCSAVRRRAFLSEI